MFIIVRHEIKLVYKNCHNGISDRAAHHLPCLLIQNYIFYFVYKTGTATGGHSVHRRCTL